MAELNKILHKINALKDLPEAYLIKQLIDYLRVPESILRSKPDEANQNIGKLIELLKSKPEYANGLAIFIFTLLNKKNCIASFTDTGILSDESFSDSLMRLIGHRVAPLLPEESSLVDLVDFLFDNPDDLNWLSSIDIHLWYELIDLLQVDDDHLSLIATTKNSILNAMVILSYRISGIGLHHELMKAYPQMLDYSASFVAQNQEAVLFANEYREAHQLDQHHDIIPSQTVDAAPLLVMLEQCDNIVNTVRKRIYKTGISIRLTNMLLRLEQSINRTRILSELLTDDRKIRDKALVELAQAIIVSVKRRYSFGYLINNNTKLLSRKITENSGRVGEHYISTDRSGYFKMFKKAAIGGLIIAFMATFKILSYDLDLAPMSRAFVNSMIYGLGFVFIHIIHGTVATKQPAMTAAAIASTISDSSGKKSHKLVKVSELMVDILRTQFIAIMGNVLIAAPLALVISFVWMQYSGSPMITTDKASHLLHDLDPIHSPALFHAAIAGVYLFLAGLIAGYYDNLALFNNIGERIANHKLLLKIMPNHWVKRLGTFIDNNLGAIMSNFLFGVFLGSTATIGYIFGLPLDIRHIAFSSANFTHGLFNIAADDFSVALVLISVIGVALIGIINLMVSFSLAMIVAMRSKGVQIPEWKNIAKLLFTHFVTQPRDFLLPRPEPMQYSKIDSKGYMIYEELNKSPKNQFVQRHFAVRRLAGVKVTSEGVAVVSQNHRNEDTVDTAQKTESVATKPDDFSKDNKQDKKSNRSSKNGKLVLLSDLVYKPVSDMKLTILNTRYSNRSSSHSKTTYNNIPTNKLSISNHESETIDNSNTSKYAKASLPKPQRPPKLPD